METEKDSKFVLGEFDREELKEFTDIILKLLEQNISFNDVLDFDFEVLKAVLEDFDKSLIDCFWKQIEKCKNSEEKNNELEIEKFKNSEEKKNELGDYDREELKEFTDIIQKLLEQNISFNDVLDFDFEVLKAVLEGFDELLIDCFWKQIEKCKNSEEKKDDEITLYFQSKNIKAEFEPLIAQLNSDKDISFQNLLLMKRKELSDLLSKIEVDENIKINFISIIELETFFSQNNFTNNLFENIKNVCILKKVFLPKLSDLSKNKVLELFLFVLMCGLTEILPQEFIDNLIKSNFSIAKLLTLKAEELQKLGLKENELRIFTNSLDIFKQCSLRKFSIFELGHAFLTFVCHNNISMKEIDQWTESNYDQIKNLSNKAKIIQLLNQNSQLEIFLSDVNLKSVDKNLLNILKYIDFDTVSAWNLNSFLKINPKLGPTYKEIIPKIKTYDSKKNFTLENVLNAFENKLNDEKSEYEDQNNKLNENEYQMKIQSLKKEDGNYIEELNTVFQQYSDDFPEASQKFYQLIRKNVGLDLEFYMNENYFNSLAKSFKVKLINQLDENDKKSKSKVIENVFRFLLNNREELFENLLVSFGNAKTSHIFINFIVYLEEFLPMVYDKHFPSYLSLIVKHSKNKPIVEILIDLFKELQELTIEEENIINTRNLINTLISEGEEFFKDVYDEFPDLENYLYFDNRTPKKDSFQNKISLLLRKLNNEIGSSFLEDFLKTNKNLCKLSNLALQEECGVTNDNNLEFSIQKLNNDGDEFFKASLLKEYLDLKCSKEIELPTSTSLQLLLSKLNNEIDPAVYKKIISEFPQFREIEILKKETNTETLSDLIQELNEKVGYFSVEALFIKLPELKEIDLKINPNVIKDEDLKLIKRLEFENEKNEKDIMSLKREESVESSENEDKNDKMNAFEKINIQQEIMNKINLKNLNKNSTLNEFYEKIKLSEDLKQRIITLRTEKIKIEQEILGILEKKK